MARMIALQACRHGIGCSHLVANLAVLLMQRGYRVGLLDTDAKMGGIRTLFGLDSTPERDTDAFWWLCQGAKATRLHTEFRPYSDAFPVPSAGIYIPPLGGHFALKGKQFRAWQQRYNRNKPFDVLQCLAHDLHLDFLLIDNQPELVDENLLVLSLADIAIVLLQLDTYDLQRAAVLLEILGQLEISETWLVPSLVLPTLETNIVCHMLESTYQYPVAGVLHLSEELMSLASQGVFCLHYPDHALTQMIEAIAHQIEESPKKMSTISSQS
jgi:MinD-like ATPase involved in chromosome partitioning or flagellar assembly